ncbi:MAG: NucA/NucB deoxyribonuclease domain-containing protein [Flavobacterium sp.]|jgi:hypothetical protein|nr:NucA/NucB deoxyribonuclease domain-containing protein [Flavobacterium sp.]
MRFTNKLLFTLFAVALLALGFNFSTKEAVALPAVTFDSAKVPNIVSHIKAAQTAGKPKTLTRTTDATRISSNRSAACKNFSGTGSCDEYPFASTYEGGAGASTRGVPSAEQSSQGGTLSAFYTANSIVDGSKFDVLTK